MSTAQLSRASDGARGRARRCTRRCARADRPGASRRKSASVYAPVSVCFIDVIFLYVCFFCCVLWFLCLNAPPPPKGFICMRHCVPCVISVPGCARACSCALTRVCVHVVWRGAGGVQLCPQPMRVWDKVCVVAKVRVCVRVCGEVGVYLVPTDRGC